MIILLLALLGVALGSFVNALVWRIYMSIGVKSKKHNAKKGASNQEYSILKGRSMCPSCEHQLAGKDLVPVFSWLSLKGKCRYCKKSISWQYPVVEVVSGFLFALSFVFWPYEISGAVSILAFALWLVALTIGLALTIYDLKWMLLPNCLVYPLGAIGAVFCGVLALQQSGLQVITSAALGLLLFGGFFYLMYQISKGKWIGGGDVRLGFALGLILGWQKSILGLTLAAYLATAVILVLFLLKKYKKNMKLPFGPFLLSATFITFLWGQSVIDWYLRISGL